MSQRFGIRLKSIFLVGIQFLCIGLLLYEGAVTHSSTALIICGGAMVIGLWAVMIMTASKLSIFPEVKEGAIMIRRGPYKLIRHPMYLAVILFCLGEVLAFFTVFRLIVILVLVIDLFIKMRYEESILEQKFSEYTSYKRTTRKIIPFIY